MYSRVIFSIDGVEDIHTNAKFMRHVDTLRAMGKLNTEVALCIGNYQGGLEQSFMASQYDFEKHFKAFCKDQDSFLYVPGDTRQPCVLRNFKGEYLQTLLPMRQIDKPDGDIDYTYVVKTKTYWIC